MPMSRNRGLDHVKKMLTAMTFPTKLNRRIFIATKGQFKSKTLKISKEWSKKRWKMKKL